MVRGGLLLFFTMLIGVAAFGQTNVYNPTLQDFKEGIYVYKNGEYRGGRITRTKKWQVEEYPHLHLKIKFRIDWIADFEYHLTCVEVSDPASECILGDIIKVKILDVEQDTYSLLVQKGRKLEKIDVQMLDDDPKNQNKFRRVLNNFNYME